VDGWYCAFVMLFVYSLFVVCVFLLFVLVVGCWVCVRGFAGVQGFDILGFFVFGYACCTFWVMFDVPGDLGLCGFCYCWVSSFVSFG